MKVSDIAYIRGRIGLVKKISGLKIQDAGTDTEKTPYIRLEGGTIFFGKPSLPKEKKYYQLLPKKIREKLPFICFSLANDIIIRYVEGGLKYKGPRKEQFYQVKNGDYIAEMGAYMGHYTIYLAQKAQNSGKVIAIEPMPDNLEILRKNVSENKLDNVIIVPKGVWNSPGEMTFQRKKNDHQSASIDLDYQGSSEKLSISVDSLDNILTAHQINMIDFMIIQLNGAEIEALEGLTRIAPNHISIAARYQKNGKDAAPLIKEMLQKRNYKTEVVQNAFLFARKAT